MINHMCYAKVMTAREMVQMSGSFLVKEDESRALIEADSMRSVKSAIDLGILS